MIGELDTQFEITEIVNKRVEKNSQWLAQMERGTNPHWVIFEEGKKYRAIYNGLTYWVKVFEEHPDGSLTHLLNLQTLPEEDEETGETYLPHVTEGAIRSYLGWWTY